MTRARTRPLSRAAPLLALAALIGCSERHDPTGPSEYDGSLAIRADIAGGSECFTRGDIEVCRLPTLGGSQSSAGDINDDGWIVGSSQTAEGNFHATLWTPDGSIVDVTETLGFSSANAVSNAGWIAGTARSAGKTTAARWSEATGFEIVDLSGNLNLAVANEINDRGEVAGLILEGTLFRALKWTSFVSIITGRSFSQANDIDRNGKMVGQATGSNGQTQAVIFNSLITEVGPLPEDRLSAANAMNEVIPLQLVGWSSPGFVRRGLRVDGGEARELPGLGGDWTIAHDINDAGFVVGESAPTGINPTHAVLWTPGDEVTDLGGLGGPEDRSVALGINAGGTIVGQTRIGSEVFATVWRVLSDDMPPPTGDSDGDGIADDVDTQPDAPSAEFSDLALGGTTTGSVRDAGDQLLTITEEPNPAGVRIETDPTVGPDAAFADIRICGGSAALTLDAGDTGIATCTSASVEVVVGAIDITFIAENGTSAMVSLPEGHSLTFDPVTATITAPSTNPGPVIVIVDGTPIELVPGGSLALNRPPTANAGPDRTVECEGDAAADVVLDGSASTDPDDDPLTYTWRDNGSIIAGPTTEPTVEVDLGLGAHEIELTVDDGNGATATDEVVIEVVDTRPPVIRMKVKQTRLWPPNHRMVRVARRIAARDGCCTTKLQVTVESDEPVDGRGDGRTRPDHRIVERRDGRFDVWVRAERSGRGDGRVYTITAIATDCAGNVAEATKTVTVPKSNRRRKKHDDRHHKKDHDRHDEDDRKDEDDRDRRDRGRRG